MKHMAIGLGLVAALSAQDAAADQLLLGGESGAWRYGLTGYLFAPVSTSGSSTINGVSADLDMSLSEALEVLDFTISGRFEAWNGDFGLVLEGNYLGISDDQAVILPGSVGAGLGVKVDVEQYWLSALGSYRFAKGRTGTGQPYALDVQAGARFNSLQQDVDLRLQPGALSLGGTETWWEPVVALRGVLALNEAWQLAGLVDLAGFGVNGNDLAASVSLGADWQAWENTSVKFGWRFYSIDYETRRPGGDFAYDITQHGPFIGLSWVFD
ncbi:MAG: hypothetical protein OIF40_13265 [Mangrovicoccus sp.]|nr:hypothetical protein [Mangrovicoccus sp.]